MEVRKRPHFSRTSTIVLFTSFSEILQTTERLTGWWFLAVGFSPTFLNTGPNNETFQQYGKQDLFRQLLKSSASSGSQHVRTTTRVQSGPDALDKSRLVMTFLTILGVKEILCNFRLVLIGKTDKEMPESSRLEF